MDEPLDSLDNACKTEIISSISPIARDLHIPIIYITHSIEEMKALAGKDVCVENGVADDRTTARVTSVKPVPEYNPPSDILWSV